MATAQTPNSVQAFTEVADRLTAVISGLEGLAPSLPETLQFDWEELVFTGRIFKSHNSKSLILELAACLGTLPFTAENGPGRSHLVDFTRRKPDPLFGHYVLGPNGRVDFIQRTVLDAEASPATLLQTLTICLLQARPYLKTIQAVMQPVQIAS